MNFQSNHAAWPTLLEICCSEGKVENSGVVAAAVSVPTAISAAEVDVLESSFAQQ